jgi:hypothetical protein
LVGARLNLLNDLSFFVFFVSLCEQFFSPVPLRESFARPLPARALFLLDLATGQLDGDLVDIVQELLAGGEPEGGCFNGHFALGDE